MQKALGSLHKASDSRNTHYRDKKHLRILLVLEYESIWEASISLHAFLADFKDVNKYLMDGLSPV